MNTQKYYLVCKLLLLICFYISTPSASAADFYWIGGTGNWSDLSNWSLESGGTDNAERLPDATDRVIFDEHSFSAQGAQVILDLDTLFCQDFLCLDQSHQAALVGRAAQVLVIHGNLSLEGNLDIQFGEKMQTKSKNIEVVILPLKLYLFLNLHFKRC